MQLSQYENIFSVNPLQRIKQSTDLFKMKSSIYEYSQFCVDVCQPKKKQRRLKSVFSDADIVACKSGDKSCYVKGRLQPTRSLGDIRLKFKEFNNPKSVLEDKGCLKSISNFKGPYISVTIYEIQKGDRYLVLGSDRLWDELTKSEISKVCILKLMKDCAKKLNQQSRDYQTNFQDSLSHAAISNKMSDEEIRKIPLGKRRKLHDDITVILVDLQGQV